MRVGETKTPQSDDRFAFLSKIVGTIEYALAIDKVEPVMFNDPL